MKAPLSKEVKEIIDAGKGHELVALVRKGGGLIDVGDKTYRIKPSSHSSDDDHAES